MIPLEAHVQIDKVAAAETDSAKYEWEQKENQAKNDPEFPKSRQ